MCSGSPALSDVPKFPNHQYICVSQEICLFLDDPAGKNSSAVKGLTGEPVEAAQTPSWLGTR